MGTSFVRRFERTPKGESRTEDRIEGSTESDSSETEGLGSIDNEPELKVGDSFSVPTGDIPRADTRSRDGGNFDDGNGTGGSSGPKRRGRKPGSKNRQTKEESNSLSGLEEILLSVHMMGAIMFKCPELAIEESEAKKVRIALEKVAKYHPISVVSGETMAWVNLATALGTVYGTRAIAIRNRIRDERKEERAREQANKPPIFQMPNPQQQKYDAPPPPPKPQKETVNANWYPPASGAADMQYE